MNNNDYNYQNRDGQKEEIRFDDCDFGNPYSKYYRSPNQNGFGADFEVDEEPIYDPPVLIDEEKEKRNLSRIGVGYALYTVIGTLSAVLIYLIVYYTSPAFIETALFKNLLTPVSMYLFALPVLLMILSKCEAKPPEKKKLGFGAFMIFLITAFGFMYIGAIIGDYVMELFSYSFGYEYNNAIDSLIDYDNLLITAVYMVVVAPVCEEFVFRKLLIDRTHKYGGFVSIGLSALMFGLMHGNIYQLIYGFLVGLLLGYIYYSTGKLYITIAIHSILNFVGSVIPALLSPVTDALVSIDPNDTAGFFAFIDANLWLVLAVLAFSVFIYAAMACGVIFPIAFGRKLKFRRGELELPRKKIIPIVVLNYGIIAMILLYLYEIGSSLIPPN